MLRILRCDVVTLAVVQSMEQGRLYAAARAAARLTQAEAAKLCSWPVTAIRSLENGRNRDNCEVLRRVLQTQQVSVHEHEGSIAFPRQTDNEFGHVIAVARAGAGISQADFALFSGVSLRTISSIEAGTTSPTTAIQDALVACLARRGVEICLERTDRWGVHIIDPQDVQPGERRFPTGENAFEIAMDNIQHRATNAHVPEMVRLRIEVDGTEPLIWREILIPENATFADLHCTIQTVFGWRSAHLHEFRCGLTIGNIYELNEEPISNALALDERLITLNQVHYLFPQFQYLYDFGDNWRHLIKVGDKVQRGDRPVRPVLIDGSGGVIIENSGGSGQWNKLATSLRRGKASRDTLNWLQQCGYGRAFDPDRLDIEEINQALVSTGFDIPGTWHEEWARRDSVTVTAKHLRDDYPRPSVRSRFPGSSFTVISVEDFTEEDFDRDWISDATDGMAFGQSLKMGRTIPLRSLLADLTAFLDQSSDVVSFRSFPKAIRWREGKREGVFHPDLEVVTDKRKKFLLHFALSEEEAAFVNTVTKMTGLEILLFGGGLADANVVQNCNQLRSLARGVKDDPSEVRTVLEKVQFTKGIAVAKALRSLISQGVTELSGFTGGSPEKRAKSRLASAVVLGAVGIDMKKPFDVTTIGLPSLTSATCQFLETAEPYRL